MKEKLVYLMVLLLVLCTVSGGVLAEEAPEAEGTEIQTEVETEEEPEGEIAPEEEPAIQLPPLEYDYNELTVGATMPMYGTFFTSMWGNGSSDIDVRMLIHGYNLVQWNAEVGGFQFDESVVSGSLPVADEEGNHIFTLVLYDDLFYSDGTPVTAWDYAFSILLRIAPEIAEIGGTPAVNDFIVGYQAYISGETPYLAGVRVIDDHQLMISISSEYLPFFYELALLDCLPYPASVIAPGCQVADDGEGVYIRNVDTQAAPLFTADLLRQTILDSESGYLSHPTVTCGPYRLVSFDGAEARFALNEYYKGNSRGEKPVIPQIVFKTANPETMLDELMNGEYGLLNKVTSAALIQEGTERTVEDGRFDFANYPRSGLSFISFNMERPAVSNAVVRRAMALCMDKDALVSDTVGNYGLRVDGYYGLGQWMYQILNETIAYPVDPPEEGAGADAQREYEETLEAWEELTLDNVPVYEFNVEEAIRLLEEDGWTLNGQGMTYDAQRDSARCKLVGNELVSLNLTLVYPETSKIASALEEHFAAHLAEAGIQLNMKPSADVLALYYGAVERDCDLLFLASNFDVLFDPAPLFEPNGTHNYTGVDDQTLYDLTVDMRKTEPGDVLSYCQKWVLFQERFSEVEPMIPIYSNVYFDFYPRVLHNYAIAENISWAQAAVPAYMSDIEEEATEAPEAGEELGEGEIVIGD